MCDNKKKEFLGYLDLSIQNSQDEVMKLITDSRNDEADHEKVRANIFQIFKTVFQGIINQKNLSEEEAKTLFLSKTETIPINWKKSYENAKAFQDAEKILIEEFKLKTLEEIQNIFYKIWEVADDRS